MSHGPRHLPRLERLPGSQDLQGSFEAFKFSDTSVVKFQVNVAFCVGGCNPVSCQNGIQSYGRRRRDAPGSALITSRSLVYDQNLGQEVLLSNTPLSAEIYVETGTKVDPLKEAGVGYLGGRDSKAVFILGDDSESELVCTTLPVVITAGAAVIFLQLCLLATCILCLYSSRRSKAREERAGSDGQSLHSGRSSTTSHPTLHTLYHDQLTFRPALPSVTNSRATENSANTLKSLRTNLRD